MKWLTLRCRGKIFTEPDEEEPSAFFLLFNGGSFVEDDRVIISESVPNFLRFLRHDIWSIFSQQTRHALAHVLGAGTFEAVFGAFRIIWALMAYFSCCWRDDRDNFFA